jgi:FkbM family methyltransferase
MDLRHFLRWLSVMPRIVWRSDGLGDRLSAVHCLARSVAAHAGIRLEEREFQLKLDGNTYYVDAARRDITPYASVWIEREYEPDARFMPPRDGVVVDIGAQVGFLTTRMARHVTSGRVIAIEPDPVSFSRLQRSVAANALKNVTLVQCALSNEEGKFTFASAEHSVDSRLLIAGQVPPRLVAQPGTRTSEVECTTLDHLTSRERIDRIDLLKVDVEGAEIKVLEAAEKTLSRVQAMLIEIHSQTSIATITNLLARAGLKPAGHRGNVHGFLRSAP